MKISSNMCALNKSNEPVLILLASPANKLYEVLTKDGKIAEGTGHFAVPLFKAKAAHPEFANEVEVMGGKYDGLKGFFREKAIEEATPETPALRAEAPELPPAPPAPTPVVETPAPVAPAPEAPAPVAPVVAEETPVGDEIPAEHLAEIAAEEAQTETPAVDGPAQS